MITRLLASAAILAMAIANPSLAQTASKDVGTEVIVKGVPRLRPAPEEPLPPLDIFMKPARIEQIALSPDGSRIAFTTHVDGQQMLATYVIDGDIKHAIKLDSDTITAITWVNNDYILLSASLTGLRGTCPSGGDQRLDDQKSITDLVPSIQNKSGGPATAGNSGTQSAADNAIVSALLNTLRTPGCAYYGVRSQEAVTVVDLKDDKGTTVGKRMNQYDNMALGIPKAVTVDGRTEIVGPFLELRLDSMNRQPTQRVYLWSVDPETGVGKMVNDDGGDLDREQRYVDDWLVDDHGKPYARTVYQFRSESFIIQTRDGKSWKPILTKKIEDRAKTFAPYLAGLGRDGQALVILARDEKDQSFHYYELARDGTLSPPLEPEDALHDRPIFNPATGRLAGFARDSVAPTYELSDSNLARIYEAGQDSAPGQSVRIAATARDARRMIIFSQGGNDAGNYYFVDMVKGTFIDLGNDHVAIPAEWVANQSLIEYPAADGLTIQALLTRPSRNDAKSLPLIVLPHDGPQGSDTVGYNWLAQALASRGYLVLQPNYRGSDGAGAAFRAAGDGEWGGKIPDDLDAGVRHLATQGLADPNRVCIAGFGYGGYLALNGAVSGGTYRCAAAINGISDVADYTTWISVNRPVLDPDDLGGVEVDSAWPGAFRPATGSQTTLQRYLGQADRAAISPINKAAAAKPILLIRGEDDDAVPAEQSHHMAEALKQAGKPADYRQLPGCDHSMTSETCRLATAEALLDFLGKYNPPS